MLISAALENPKVPGEYTVKCGVTGDYFIAYWDGEEWLHNDSRQVIAFNRKLPDDMWEKND